MVYEAWKSLVEDFAKLKKPWGTRDNPAKTCRDLALAYPEMQSGTALFNKIFFSIRFQEIIGSIRTKVTTRMPSWYFVTFLKKRPAFIRRLWK